MTIEDMWQAYAAAVNVPPGGLQWKETKTAFFAGVGSVMFAVRNLAKSGASETEVSDYVQAVHDEGAAFMATVRGHQ